MKNKVLFIILSFVISWIIYYFVISFFVGKKTLSQYLLKLDRLTFDKQKKSTILFEDGFLGFIKQFYTLFFITLVAGGVNLLSFSFIVIGIVTINITHLIMLSLILSIISLIIKFSSKTYQGIGERMFKIELYEETIS